jgi:hypothetical protein
MIEPGELPRFRLPSGARARRLCRVLLLLALASLSAPALAQKDPFAPEAAGASGEAQPPAPGPGGDVAQMMVDCEHITAELCGKTNTALVASAAGYVVVCVLVFTMISVWWNRRGTSTAGVRFVVPLLFACAAAAALVAFDPIRGQDLKCCLAHGVFKAQVLLNDSTAGRAALFGAVPTAALYTLVALVSRRMRG